MQHLYLKNKLKSIHSTLMCLCFFLLLGISQSFGQVVLNGVSAMPSGYEPGTTSTISFTIDMSDDTGAEWVDYVVMTFPAGWTVSTTTGYTIPVGNTGCGTPTISGEGTNILTVGNDDPMGAPMGGSDCGFLFDAPLTISLDVTVPMGVTGDQDYTVDIYGDGFLLAAPTFATLTQSLSEIMCVLTCPADIVVTSDLGMCGATVTIPAPTFTGNCVPAPAGITDFYPVGTTEVTLMGGGETCTVNVTVMDDEDPTIEPLADLEFNLDGGECIQVVTYTVDAVDACDAMPVVLTQSTDPASITNSIACPGGENIYSRVFDLAAEGQLTDVEVNTVEIGVFQSFGSPEVTVRISELNGALTNANLTVVAEATQVLPDLFVETFDFPIEATLNATGVYVIQVFTPGSIFNGFVMGTNAAGQTGSSYIESSFCSLNEFTDFSSIGFGGEGLVINIEGMAAASSLVQTEGLPSGSAFPIGVTTNTFILTDAAGNMDTMSFNVTVNGFDAPIDNLACNNLVNISLDEDCVSFITPDMVLEGGPYSCYDFYTVVIIDEDGNETVGGLVEGFNVGETLIVEVRDSSGNKCWGEVFIEDKLAPELECTTRTSQCNAASFDPFSAIPSRIRFANDELTNNIIPDIGANTMDIPFEVEGLHGTAITDLNIDIDISHTWINDLGVSLISPEGTEVILILQPACIGEDMVVTLDDSADQTLNDGCTANVPAIEGTFQPFASLSAFDGENPNGTWIFRVSDFFNGDGGSVNNIEMEFTQIGGVIGLPLPQGAFAIAQGNQTYNVIGLDPCGDVTLTYEDEVENMDCFSPFTQVIYRTYTAVDESGNEAMSCTDTINVLRTDLSTLEFPPNFDDIENDALSCTASYPLPSVTGSPTGDFCDNVEITFEDSELLDICEGSYKILRTWQVFEWCNSEVVEHIQVIKVSDEVGPSISVTSPDVVSTSPLTCDGSLLLPVPSISDNCTTNPTYMVESEAGTLVQQGSNFFLNDLEVGTTTVTYTAFDDCGNFNSTQITVTVEDLISPVAVCDQHTTVSLSFDETVTVDALTFDDGSYDECTSVDFAVRRMTDNCGVAGNTAYGPSVTFCCADVGDVVMVEFRVTDENGLSNTCMVEVTVDDKIAPVLVAPPNVTLNCQDDYTDLNLTGGLATGYDNCELDEVTFTDIVSIGNCGSGQVIRAFTVQDKSGLTANTSQIITLIDNDPFDLGNINFPNNVTLFSCDDSTAPEDTGIPTFQDDACSQVSYAYWDDVFEIADGACLQIYRKWTVIDQCQYNATTGFGSWEDIQVIEIVNNIDPEFTSSCSNVSFDVFGSCEGQVTLEVEAEDDCTQAEDLTYSWRIDAFNTGDLVFEFEGEGKSLTNTFPVGTHRIIWTVLDNCGNSAECDYLFTVRDAKAPTPYCISTLSTAVMNTNGEVVIWASDFDLGATDNCTAQGDLTISFTEFGVTNSRTFSCANITNGVSNLIEDIQIWVTDEAGNKDFCTVSLLLEDNEANICDDVGSITVSGSIEDTKGKEITDVSIIATSAVEEVFTDATITGSTYSFDLLPNMNYTISAEKNLGPLNGITTIDIVMIQRHILAITPFDSPYKTIAADVDNNAKVNGLDIIQIRKLLLGYQEDFVNGQESWRFVKKDQEFADNFDVFPYEETIEVDFTGDMGNKDFVGVKIADINGSADPSELISDADARSNEQLDFFVNNMEFEKGELLEIPVYAENFEHMLAYQMTLEYNAALIEVLDIESGELEVTEQDVNMAFAQKGYITTVWSSSKPVDAKDVLFTLIVEAKKAGTLNDMFSTSDRVTRTLSYRSMDQADGISWKVRSNGIDAEEIKTLEASVSPNPFSDVAVIRFELPTSTEVVLHVFDMEGRQVMKKEQAFGAGFHTIELNASMLNGSGVYYYSITTKEDSVSGRMILID